MSENEQQQQTAFCLKEIENSKTLILTLSARFPKIRAAYEKYKGTGLKREYDSLVDLPITLSSVWLWRALQKVCRQQTTISILQSWLIL